MIAFIVPACGNPSKMAEKADQMLSASCEPQTLEVVAGKINAKVVVNFPEDFFHPKAIVEVVPVIVYRGGEAAGEPFVLQGEDVTDNYITVAKDGAAVSREFTFDYAEGMEDSHLELRMTVLHKDKRIPFTAPLKVADGANTTYMLVGRSGNLAYAPDAYQPVIEETNEAQILYQINSSVVRPSQLKSEEIKAFQEFLNRVSQDERRTVTGTDIISYASPDGKEEQNAKLAERRNASASKAFAKTINKKAGIEAPVNARSVAEDWDGFQELVKNSNIEDRELILRVLEMYSDPMVREREIKNMSQVYTMLAKEILPQLRRARFIANIEFQNYTDEELLDLVESNIEMLDEEALLHTASLIRNLDKKAAVYTKAIDKFGSDRAKHNKAVVMLYKNDVNAAEQLLSGVQARDGYYYNTLGVIALRKGDNEAAAAAFAKSSLKESRYNLGILDIWNGDYREAAAKLNGQGHHPEVLSAILVNDLAKAEKIAGCKCPTMNYLKAIIYARQGKVQEAQAALEIASKNEALAKRAETDIEFAKIR